MIILDDNPQRVIPRKHALGIKEIIISDDVLRGDEVESDFDDSGEYAVLNIKKSDKQQLDENGDPIYTFVTKEFGLYGLDKGFRSLLELKFCDDGIMFINLIAGSIAIRPEGNIMKASRAIDSSKIPNCTSSDILWVNAEKLLAYAGYLAKFADRYPYDYEYFIEVGGTKAGGMESISVRKHCDATDISCGALAIKEAEEQSKAQAKEARKMARMFMNQTQQSKTDDFDCGDDEEEYDDDDDFDF